MAAWEGKLVGGAVAAVLLVMALLLQLRKRGRRNYEEKNSLLFPPGPPGWPVIGHWPLLRLGTARETLADLARNHGYGPIIGLRLGPRPAVAVCSAQFARELLLTHDKIFANRPAFHFAKSLFYGFDSAIIFSNYGSHLSSVRKLCTLELFTAKRLQELQYIRQEEMRRLLDRLRRSSISSTLQQAGAAAVGVEHVVADMSCEIVTRLLHSRSSAETSRDDLSQLIRDVEDASVPTLGDFIPWLKWLNLLQRGKQKHIHHKIDRVIESMIFDRRQLMKTSPPQELPHDFLQVLLSKEMVIEDGEEHLTTIEIKGIILDIFAGGVHTSSFTVEWAMSELIGNPRVINKVRNEIDSLKGKGKDLITDEDIAKLPYLVSVVKEVFRLHPVVPLLVPRISREACNVGKYTLPKGTQVFVNVWGIARDPEVWDRVDEFYPERFECSKKDVDVRGLNYELLPFGSGRRMCPGMRLGLSIVHVTVANLVRFFEWELPQGHNLDMSEMKGRGNAKSTRLLAIPTPRLLD